MSLVLLAIAEGCGNGRGTDTDRTCPGPDVSSMTPEKLCSELAGEYNSISGDKLVRPHQADCAIERTFLDRLRESNPHLFPDLGPIGVVDAGGDVAFFDAEFSDALSADATSDAAPDANDAGATDAKAPKVVNCPSFDRKVVLTCSYECRFGRPFEGFEHTGDAFGGVRGFFAACARTEAASVDAFLILANELRSLGAPTSLVAECEKAAREERAHARTMSELACIAPVTIEAPSRAKRGALAIALENARSGLVVETFAALLNHVQSLNAPSVLLRNKFAAIAAEESGHAELSRRIHAFVAGVLSDEERSAVEAERRSAIADLDVEIRKAPPSTVNESVGLPPRGQQLALFEQLKRQVWASDEMAA